MSTRSVSFSGDEAICWSVYRIGRILAVPVMIIGPTSESAVASVLVFLYFLDIIETFLLFDSLIRSSKPDPTASICTKPDQESSEKAKEDTKEEDTKEAKQDVDLLHLAKDVQEATKTTRIDEYRKLYRRLKSACLSTRIKWYKSFMQVKPGDWVLVPDPTRTAPFIVVYQYLHVMDVSLGTVVKVLFGAGNKPQARVYSLDDAFPFIIVPDDDMLHQLVNELKCVVRETCHGVDALVDLHYPLSLLLKPVATEEKKVQVKEEEAKHTVKVKEEEKANHTTDAEDYTVVEALTKHREK